MPRMRRALAAALAASAWACSPRGSGAAGGAYTEIPSQGVLASIPLGDVAGSAQSGTAAEIANPYAGQPAARAEGEALFARMNCVGCHGYDGTGGMGPDLTDGFWRYGGTPAEIYNSIAQGRPKGMPAWGAALPEQEIWKLVEYVGTLGGGVAPRDFQAARQGDLASHGGAASSLKGRHAEDEP